MIRDRLSMMSGGRLTGDLTIKHHSLLKIQEEGAFSSAGLTAGTGCLSGKTGVRHIKKDGAVLSIFQEK